MQRQLELSDTPPRTRRRRSPVIRGLAALAAAAGLALASASPALAWADDRPKITNQGIDFGLNWDGFGAPLNGGELHWHVDSDGDIDPHLVGNLYLNNASGTTARMRIDYYNAAHQWLNTSYGGEVTAPDNARHTYSVDLSPYEHPSAVHVHVSTTTETGTPGEFQIVGTAIEEI
jgi:hypothetical protein